MIASGRHTKSYVKPACAPFLALAVIILCLTLLRSSHTYAQETNPVPPPTTAQLKRAHALYKEIRCPVCTAQPISESDASLSQNMRDRILREIQVGQSNEEILAGLTQTYGDDIRLLPKKEPRTYVLWTAPWAIILIGFIILVLMRHRRRISPQKEPMETSGP